MWTAGLIVIIASTSIPQQVDGLGLCKKLYEDFNTQGMLAVCDAAANDAKSTAPDRAEALRLLGMAQLLSKDVPAAEASFVRMLVHAPDKEMPPDAGPAAFQALERARATYTAKHPPPPPPAPLPPETSTT